MLGVVFCEFRVLERLSMCFVSWCLNRALVDP
jgi:hypothetical protein